MASVFRNRRMDEQTEVQSYNRIPQQREQTIETCNDLGASKKHYAEGRPCTKAVHSCMSPFSGSGSRTGYTSSWWAKWEEILASVE